MGKANCFNPNSAIAFNQRIFVKANLNQDTTALKHTAVAWKVKANINRVWIN